jgi:outer membrane protein assembly factor BamB
MKLFQLMFMIGMYVQICAQDFAALSDSSVRNVDILNGTFLGNWQRNYYGDHAPESLHIIWRHYLGEGKTVISTKIGEKLWKGSGWTGQPLLVAEDKVVHLIQGAFDHHLKKIDTRNGSLIWQYKFDDVIKGTGTIWQNKHAQTLEESLVIMQGSRRGLTKNLNSRYVPSFRAVSYFTGNELWRLNSKRTPSYSRDVDGSAVVLNDTAYIGLENALFIVFNPNLQYASQRDGMLQPQIYQELLLYSQRDIYRHGGNLVTESSPAILGEMIFITSGSGHVYGYDLKKKQITWEYYTGSDIDGSPVVTPDSCILVPVEKQYITGQGGLLKLDPFAKKGNEVRWYFPTEDDSVISWQGGVIGSAAINSATKPNNFPHMCAVLAIDGYLYVLNLTSVKYENNTMIKVPGPDGSTLFPIPQLLYKYKVGPSIATPIFVGNKLVVPTYNGLFLFKFDNTLGMRLIDSIPGISFESTGVTHAGRLYIGARNGYLYCLGSH